MEAVASRRVAVLHPNLNTVDAQAVITKEIVTAEDRSSFDKMIAAADVDGADITRMQGS